MIASQRRRLGDAAFFARVYRLVRRIPRGKVATYGQVARLLGAPRSARVVGWAMHDNPHGSRVPCHRVVQKGGSLSPNYCLADLGRQRRLLEREGVDFGLDGRVIMATHQWNPTHEKDGGHDETQGARDGADSSDRVGHPAGRRRGGGLAR